MDIRKEMKAEILNFLNENPGGHTYEEISEVTGFSMLEVDEIMKELEAEGEVWLTDDYDSLPEELQ